MRRPSYPILAGEGNMRRLSFPLSRRERAARAKRERVRVYRVRIEGAYPPITIVGTFAL